MSSTFSEVFRESRHHIESLVRMTEPRRPMDEVFQDALTDGGLDTDSLASIMAWSREPRHRAEILSAAKRIRKELSPPTVELVIPVYLTSFCENECLYCGYRQSNALARRTRLSLDDFTRVLDLILSWGHRQIELVLSEDPQFGPEVVARYVELTRQRLDRLGGGVVGLCSPVYRQEDYVRLRDAGLEWVVEWQETYHPSAFDRWHPAGSPKRHLDYRLDLWDRVIAAGIKKIALGALLGLYDWRYDVLATCEHANYLRRTYGLEPHALGIARVKPARGVPASQKKSRFEVGDDDYRSVVTFYHLAFPRSRLFFNTRESYDLNISLVEPGDLFTVDCDTFPGGYLWNDTPGQFSTHGYPARREVVETLAAKGLKTLYLGPETPPPATPSRTPRSAPNLLKWKDEHDAIRAGLGAWQEVLLSLGMHPGEGRESALEALRTTTHSLKTTAMEHCLDEENVLFPVLATDNKSQTQVEEFRTAHERLAIDFGEFERQMSSFQLSGDPTVLFALSGRMIRELNQHLAAEESVWAQVYDSTGGSERSADLECGVP